MKNAFLTFFIFGVNVFHIYGDTHSLLCACDVAHRKAVCCGWRNWIITVERLNAFVWWYML